MLANHAERDFRQQPNVYECLGRKTYVAEASVKLHGPF
jgi:hypothetical protein